MMAEEEKISRRPRLLQGAENYKNWLRLMQLDLETFEIKSTSTMETMGWDYIDDTETEPAEQIGIIQASGTTLADPGTTNPAHTLWYKAMWKVLA